MTPLTGVRVPTTWPLNNVHLIDTLIQEYALHIDWEAADYIVLTMEWDYDKNTVAISMPGCVKKAIERFGVKTGSGANSPMIYEPLKYGAKVQYAKDEEEIAEDPSMTKRIQQIVGVFLYTRGRSTIQF